MEQPDENPFPDTEPIRSNPTLWRINGVGTTMMGRRDEDPETGTYIKTQVFTFLLVPLFAIKSFRVADAEGGGWFFLGRTPLSNFARNANLAMGAFFGLALLIGSVAVHLASPEVRAADRFDDAAEMAAAQKPDDAATEIQAVADEIPEMRQAAAEQMAALIAGSFDGVAVGSITKTLRRAAPLSADRTTIASRALELATDRDPHEQFELLAVAASMDPENVDVRARREAVVDQLLAAEPDQLRWAEAKALDLAAQGDLTGAEAVLKPHRESLGSGEAARLYGGILCYRGEYDEGLPLMQAYLAPRLQRFESASKAYDDLVTAREDEIFDDLERYAPPDLERRYNAESTEAGKLEVVRQHIREQLDADPAVARLTRELQQTVSVVPAALDYGIFIIEHAQSLAGAERDAELARAEQVLIAIQGAAAGSPEFMIALGKVQCWLGKPEAGREQFDALLARERSATNLLQVASAMRDVGLREDARPLAAEAFDATDEPQIKTAAATTAGLLAQSPDERVEWLQKVEDPSPHFQAQLESALADKARIDDDGATAKAHYERQLELLASVPESPTTLNNGSTAYFALYEITGQREHFERGNQMLERALELSPTDPIIVENAAHAYLSVAVAATVGDDIDLVALPSRPGLDTLKLLYHDSRGRGRLAAKLRKHPATAKARAAFERARVLAPSNVGVYDVLESMYRLFDDVEAMEKLVESLEHSPPDIAGSGRDFAEYVAGENDARVLTALDRAVERNRRMLGMIDPSSSPIPFVAQSETLAFALMSRAQHSGSIQDWDDAVSTLEASAKAAPRQDQWALAHALFGRAIASAAAGSPELTALMKKHGRSLGAAPLGVYLVRDEKFRPLLLAQSDFERVQAIYDAGAKRYPDRVSAWDWGLISALHPDRAAKVAEALRENSFAELGSRLDLITAPYHPTSAYQHYLVLLAMGDEAAATQLLDRMGADGVELPPI